MGSPVTAVILKGPRRFLMRNLVSLAMVAMVAAFGSLNAAQAGCGTCDKTIVEVAAGNKDFSTLVAAVKAAGLVDTLGSKGPFTVFAPTNEAFAKLPEGTVETLLKPENKDKLIAILKYHVVPAKVMAEKVVTLKEAKTVEGSAVKIQVKDGSVVLNEKSKVVKADIPTINGVIHVIDTVILPPEGDKGGKAASR